MVPNLTGRPHDSGDAADLSIMGYAKRMHCISSLLCPFCAEQIENQWLVNENLQTCDLSLTQVVD